MKSTSCDSCNDAECAAHDQRPGEGRDEYLDRQALASRMCQIKHKTMVLSGKGGVGKSTVATNLAASMAMGGKTVGLLDVDIHGPSVPKLLGLEGMPLTGNGTTIKPVSLPFGKGELRVMSVAFLLPSRDEAVIWRGPRKFGLIKQFLKDVEWGELDELVVDAPPGTGDEPLAVAQLIDGADGAVIVTTPQEVAVQDVRRCIVFCNQLEVPVVGVVENMSGFTCPKCGEVVSIFGEKGGQIMAAEMKVPYLGAVPIDAEVVASGDKGRPIVKSTTGSAAAEAISSIVKKIEESR